MCDKSSFPNAFIVGNKILHLQYGEKDPSATQLTYLLAKKFVNDGYKFMEIW